MADACTHLLQLENPPDWINVRIGTDATIRELADMVKEETGFSGKLVFDPSRPDGTPRKLLDVSKMKALGWEPRISLREGIRQTYQSFLAVYQNSLVRA